MNSQCIDILHPEIGPATLLRQIGGASVYRCAEQAGYFIDWVEFAPGIETPVHNHPGIEHHLVASGCVAAVYNDNSDHFGEGEYFFWDGREPHTSYASGPRPATMLMVRGVNPQPPDCKYLIEENFDNPRRIFDGISNVELQVACGTPISTRAELFVAPAAKGVVLEIDDVSIPISADRPLAICLNPTRRPVAVRSNRRLSCIGLRA